MSIPDLIRDLIFDPEIRALAAYCSIFVSSAMLCKFTKELSINPNALSNVTSIPINPKLCFFISAALYTVISIFGLYSCYTFIISVLTQLSEAFYLL